MAGLGGDTVWIIGCLVLSIFLAVADGYGTGAPYTTCWTRYPKHNGIGTQPTVCPFLISLNPSTYTPGQYVTVTIADPDGRTFKGFEIGAFRTSDVHWTNDVTHEVVGQFSAAPDNVKFFSCFPGFRNMATHNENTPMTSLSLTWRAPDSNVGNLTFRATIVMDFERFWTRESTALPVDASVTSPVVDAAYQTPTLARVVQPVEFSECGSTKSCLYYPRYCTGDNCVSAVSFMYRPVSNDYLVEMFSDAAKNYVSVGFSDDKSMGGEETFSCVSQGSEMSVQHGINPDYYNERLFQRASVSEMEIRHANGRLECRFVIPSMGNVYRVNQSAPSADFDDLRYDKDESWYVQIAWGKSMPDSNVMSYHDDMPVVSDDKVLPKEAAIHRASAHHFLVRAHVAVMAVAWVFLSGIVTVVARHYKNWLGEKRLCGTKVWFQVHRGLAILIAVLTGVGVALIFARFDWESDIREQAIPHAYVGLALTGAVGLQLIGGLLRPGPDSNCRPAFNWCHRFLGQASHILAAVTMFLAFDIDYITGDMRKFGFIVLSIWVAVQLICHLIFEVLSCRHKDTSFDVSGTGGNGFVMDSAILVIYIIVLAGLCVAVMLSFLLF